MRLPGPPPRSLLPLLCAALIGGASAAFAQDRTPGVASVLSYETGTAEADPEQIALGREIAKGGAQAGKVQMKCMACHGLEGIGQGPVPRLGGLPGDYLATQLRHFAEGSRVHPVMSGIASDLLVDETAAVSAYYASLPPPDTRPPADLDWDLARTGRVLAYAGRQMPGETGQELTACVMCHNAAGDPRGGPIAPPLEGQPVQYITAQLEAWKAGERGGDALDVMRRIAGAMSAAEIAAVAAFYASQNPGDDRAD